MIKNEVEEVKSQTEDIEKSKVLFFHPNKFEYLKF